MAETIIKPELEGIDDDSPRVGIALEATWEIEQLTNSLLRIINDDHEMLDLRGITLRLQAVNSVIMSALSDHFEDTRSLRSRLTGRLQQRDTDMQAT